MRPTLVTVLVPGCLALALACGRGPLGDEADGTGDAASSSEADGSTPTTTDATTAAPTTTDATTGEPPPAIPEACALGLADGEVRHEIDADWAHSTLRLVVLEPGSPDAPARVLTTQTEGYGEAHNNRRARSFVFESWPDAVVETGVSLSLTRRGHSVSRLVRLADSNRFAYVWIGDPRGDNLFDTFFSVLDVDAWQVGGEVQLASNTGAGFVDLMATATTDRLLASFETDPLDAVPDDHVSGLSLGLLAADGATVAQPTPLTATAPLPGSEMRSFWAGDRVAVALSHNACAPNDELCAPHAMVVARPKSPDEHGAAVDGYAATHVFAGLPETTYVANPLPLVRFGLTWLLWYEGTDATSTDDHRFLRGVVLDAAGDPLADPVTFMPDTAMGGWPNLFVSDLGISVAFKSVDGGSFEVHHHDFAFDQIGPALVVPHDSAVANFPAIAQLDHPRSLLLAWGEQPHGEDPQIHMRRLECADR